MFDSSKFSEQHNIFSRPSQFFNSAIFGHLTTPMLVGTYCQAVFFCWFTLVFENMLKGTLFKREASPGSFWPKLSPLRAV